MWIDPKNRYTHESSESIAWTAILATNNWDIKYTRENYLQIKVESSVEEKES